MTVLLRARFPVSNDVSATYSMVGSAQRMDSSIDSNPLARVAETM